MEVQGETPRGCEGNLLERGRARTTSFVTGVIDQWGWPNIAGSAQPNGPSEEPESSTPVLKVGTW